MRRAGDPAVTAGFVLMAWGTLSCILACCCVPPVNPWRELQARCAEHDELVSQSYS